MPPGTPAGETARPVHSTDRRFHQIAADGRGFDGRIHGPVLQSARPGERESPADDDPALRASGPPPMEGQADSHYVCAGQDTPAALAGRCGRVAGVHRHGSMAGRRLELRLWTGVAPRPGGSMVDLPQRRSGQKPGRLSPLPASHDENGGARNGAYVLDAALHGI